MAPGGPGYRAKAGVSTLAARVAYPSLGSSQAHGGLRDKIETGDLSVFDPRTAFNK